MNGIQGNVYVLNETLLIDHLSKRITVLECSIYSDCIKIKNYDLIMELNTMVGEKNGNNGKEIIYRKSLIIFNIYK